ncbi:MAG: putative Ig domain-containing protein, partial [Oscillospiraceae bacterium]|nr:putative Ig domain-containing protein [Oscillospiraceae bacterium]
MRKRLLSILLTLCLVLTLMPGTAWASVENGQVDLRPTNEVRWIDRVELPDFALKLYETLENAIDGDGCNDYLIDNEYFDLDGEDVLSNGEPGDFIRGNVSRSDGSVFRYAGIVVTTTETPETDHDYISNCITAVNTAFIRDHPEAFWLQGEWQVSFIRNGIRYYCYAIICRTEGETTPYYDIRVPEFRPDGGLNIRQAIVRRDEDIETILRTIPSGADRFTQVWHLNNWLAKHNSYNVKEGGHNPWYATQCISALEGLEGTDGPVCGGYATAFQVLCQSLDIPCVFIHAQEIFDPSDHVWNYVQMEDGKWYALDLTWNDDGDDAVNRTKWFLIGGKTVIDGQEFLESHPAENPSGSSGVADFINGPVLSDKAYPRNVHLAYTGMPEKLNAGDSVAITPALIFDSGAAYTYSCTALPVGLTLDRYTGKITGTVSAVSNAVTLTVTAVNPDDPEDCAQCTLTFPAVEPLKFVDVPDWGAAEVNWGEAKG